jgi:prolyl oligopeptidase
MGTVGKAPETLKQLPAFFDASQHEIKQLFATSKDGTKVPYFMVSRKDLELDGDNPTLLYGYGGFEVSLTPGYSAGVGRAWLADGGVYVVANIRGGGEYGPRWHQAALKENRNKAYEDFAAVAEDLIARKVTRPARLGMQGGSNGGLLMGNMTVMYPQLFGKDVDYPPVLFTTSTRDDRVHPGHARKMMALMEAQGHDVTYYENIEGGHGGAANNAQSAYMSALAYTFLKQKLFKDN